MRRLWFTWETQRRNGELAAALGFELRQFDYSQQPRIVRYFKSSVRTFAALLREPPKVVVSQCPSAVLSFFLALLRPLFRFQYLIDAHNIALESATSSSLLGRLTRFAFRRADYVIVSNTGLVAAAEAAGATALVLPDRLPQILVPQKMTKDSIPKILVVSTFASDEPIEEFVSGALLVKDSRFRLIVTGKREKAGSLLRFESEMVVFPGFLPRDEYDRLLCEADLVVDLTTRENCLVCGGYEALSAGRPLLLSDHSVNREMFPKGVLFAKNRREDYARALREFFATPSRFERDIQTLRPEFLSRWEELRKAVERHILG